MRLVQLELSAPPRQVHARRLALTPLQDVKPGNSFIVSTHQKTELAIPYLIGVSSYS
jgi:hypothetical protein